MSPAGSSLSYVYMWWFIFLLYQLCNVTISFKKPILACQTTEVRVMLVWRFLLLRKSIHWWRNVLCLYFDSWELSAKTNKKIFPGRRMRSFVMPSESYLSFSFSFACIFQAALPVSLHSHPAADLYWHLEVRRRFCTTMLDTQTKLDPNLCVTFVRHTPRPDFLLCIT